QQEAALVASIVRLGTAGGERTEVAIWFSESHLLYLRVLAEDWRQLSANDRSGALELAALSVRSAVRALTLDPAEIGAFTDADAELPETAARDGLADPDPLVDPAVVVQRSVVERASASATDGVVDDRSGTDRAGTPLELRWSSELGMLGYLQGEPAVGSLALQLGLGVASGAWGLSVRGQLGIPTTSSLGPAQVELQRYAVLAEVGYFGWNAGAWQFGPLLRAGFTLTERETSSENPALAASDSRSQGSLLLGGGWSSEYRWSERFGFFMRGGLDWQASPIQYAVVTTTGEPVASAEAWALQPSLEVGGNWHW
ncbi:MAG TPA: hypothetical protein VJU61_21760, partial [Polyangiaceae bacterium]|nr:hypothetical protein [Polyangiaceae bacterium]